MRYTFLTFTIITFAFLSRAQAPVFQWAAGMGSGGVNIAYSIATDTAGNVYTTGSFSGTVDFDPGPGTYFLASAGSSDIFISKLNASGAFVWAKKVSGTNSGAGYALTTDLAGNVYITGFFSGTADFDPGPGTFSLTAANEDVFVLKLNTSGVLTWAKKMGGGSSEMGQAIDVDANGNVYTTGFFQGAGNYDPGIGTYILTPAASADIFISKLDASGTFVWAEQLRTGTGSGRSIKVDAIGNVHTAGFFSGVLDADPGPGTSPIFSAGSNDIFISKLDASGAFIWGKQIGGTYGDYCFSISLDSISNVYATGSFQLVTDFDPGPGTFSLTSAGLGDVFLCKLDAGGTFIWAKQFGAAGDDYGQSTAIDKSGNVYTGGYFNGTMDLDPGPGTFTLSSAGSDDIFISKLTGAGVFDWGLEYGGTNSDICKSMAVDMAGYVYSAGYFSGVADFDPGPGTYTLSSVANTDIFIQKLCTLPSVPVNITPANNQNICTGSSATLNAFSSGLINWYGSPTGTMVLGTGTNYVTPTLTVGNYTFYAESISCFANPVRTPIGITVTTLPVFSASTNVFVLCAGLTATLSVTGVTSATWNPGGIGTSIVVSPSVTTTYTVNGSNGGCSIAAVITQPVSPCNGIEQLTGPENELNIYPNPFTGKVTIVTGNTEEARVSIFNCMGSMIYCEKIKGTAEINLGSGPGGIYFVKMDKKNSARTFKIVKE